MALQIDSDMEFQRRAWSAQRVGWIILGLIVAAALLGLFGGGPLSRASAHGLRVNLDYQRFARLGQATRLRITLQGSPDGRLDLSRRYLESFRVERINPDPRATAASDEWISYAFSGDAPITVTFDLIPEEFGNLRGSARGAGETVLFRQLVYP